MADNYDELRSITDQFKQNIRDANDALKQTRSIVDESLKPFESLLDIAEKLNDHKRGENKLSSKQLQDLSLRVAKEKENLSNSQRSLATRLAQLTAEKTKQEQILATNHGNSKAYRDARKALSEVTDEIRQNQMAQSDLAGQIQDTDEEVKKLEKSLEKAAKKAKGFEVLNNVGDALSKIQTPLDGLLSPMRLLNQLINFMVGGIIEYDKRLGDTATSMNLTYGEADKTNKAMVAFAKSTKSAYDNSEDLNKTVVELNKNLGTSIKFEQLTGALKEDVALMSQLENIAGLTAEESQGILKYTLATGQQATQATKDLMANYKVAGLKRGVVLNEKDALKEISKLSNLIKLSTAGGAAGLAKAVASAKALGTDLNKVNDIAGSILNFEESIEAELSAELLTGKDLNLEKARQAALNNDLATLSDEIAKNVGSAAKFAKMNRIQQEQIAKAVGMTASELADTLTNQEALKNMGAATVEEAQKKFDLLVQQHGMEKAMEIMGENALTRQFQQANIQKEAEQAQKRANDLMIEALGSMEAHKESFKKVLNFVLSIIDKLHVFKGLIIAIGAIMAAKFVAQIGMAAVSFAAQLASARAMSVALKQQSSAMDPLLAKQAALTAAQVAGAEAVSFGTVTVAILAGLAAVGTAMAAFSLMSDGVVKPTSSSGFGDRVLFGPEGAISFNNKDTIVAGTDLFKANDMVSAPAGNININQSSNNSKDIAELKGAIMALAARPVDVAIDGVKVIEATTGAQPNTQGVESAKNSYRIQ